MHEDVLQAIFLHYIGSKWSVFFKSAFRYIRRHDAWNSSQTQLSKTERMRRHYFLGSGWLQDHSTLERYREDTHRNRYFAHQLLDFDEQQIEYAEGEEEAEFGDHVQPSMKRYKKSAALTLPSQSQPSARHAPRQMASQTARASNQYAGLEAQIEDHGDGDMGFGLFDSDNDGAARGPKRPMEAKQDLLHLLSTEVIVNTRLNAGLTCFRTAFESWNPLLPHQTALEVVKFFGVSKKWMAFFTKFLKAPLKFQEDDSSEVRLRQRGTPGSHALSDVFGETVLFCLDFAVNQATNGALLHRMYDDLWFWNKDYETCVEAWNKVTEFTKIMGVEVCLISFKSAASLC